MAVGYRSILRLDTSEDAIALAERHIWEWLDEKTRGNPNADIPENWKITGSHALDENLSLNVVQNDSALDGSRRRLFRIIEENSFGTWIVSVFAASFDSSKVKFKQFLVIEVDLAERSIDEAVMSIAPPRLVKSILNEVPATDGSTNLTGSPIPIRAGYSQEVIDAISDPERTAAVTVAVSLGADTDQRWKEAVKNLTSESIGVAATYVVFADAVSEFESLLPPSHQVKPGRVRTFAPHVDFTDPSESARHLWLGPLTFTRAINFTRNDKVRVSQSLKRSHAERARRRFIERDLPVDISRMMDLLQRQETTVERQLRVQNRLVPQSLERQSFLGLPSLYKHSSETNRPQEEAWVAQLRQVLSTWVGSGDLVTDSIEKLVNLLATQRLEVEVAMEQLDEAADREGNIVDELKNAKSKIEDLEIDLAISEDEVLKLTDENTIYRQRIARSAQPEDTYVAPREEIWQDPETVLELISRITPGPEAHSVLKFVEFTGDTDISLEVDRRYTTGVYAKTFWFYVRTLYDYASLCASEDFRGGVHTYLKNDSVIGTKCSPDRHAATESDTVKSRKEWNEKRKFPIPKTVSPDGFVYMYSHFKPTHKDRFAPRMHYFDDTNNSENPKIYIGYIGRHLTTKNS